MLADALRTTVEKSELEPSVVFSVQHSGKDVIVASEATILFDQILINNGGGYSATHGEFTAPLSGLYQVSYRGWAREGEMGFLGLMKNGGRISELPVGDEDFESASSQSLLTHLQQGDLLSVIVIYVSVTAGDTAITLMGEDRTTFAGYLLKAD